LYLISRLSRSPTDDDEQLKRLDRGCSSTDDLHRSTLTVDAATESQPSPEPRRMREGSDHGATRAVGHDGPPGESPRDETSSASAQ